MKYARQRWRCSAAGHLQNFGAAPYVNFPAAGPVPYIESEQLPSPRLEVFVAEVNEREFRVRNFEVSATDIADLPLPSIFVLETRAKLTIKN